jgi:hypothetical protein
MLQKSSEPVIFTPGPSSRSLIDLIVRPTVEPRIVPDETGAAVATCIWKGERETFCFLGCFVPGLLAIPRETFFFFPMYWIPLRKLAGLYIRMKGVSYESVVY